MEFYPIYDVANAVFLPDMGALIFLCIGLVPLVSIVSVFVGKQRKMNANIVGLFFVGILFTGIGINLMFHNISRYIEVKTRYKQGDYKIVTGVVENVAPYGGRIHGETFTINGIRFQYTDEWAEAPYYGFHTTAAHGGPIRIGLFVRISYIRTDDHENIILKLEIPTDQLAVSGNNRRTVLSSLLIIVAVLGSVIMIIVSILAIKGITKCQRDERLVIFRKRKFLRINAPGIYVVWPGIEKAYTLSLHYQGIVRSSHVVQFDDIEVPVISDVPLCEGTSVSIIRFVDREHLLSDIVVEPTNST